MKWNGRKPWAGIFCGFLALTGLPGIVISGCGSEANPSTPSTNEPNIEGVVYEGLATDEALVIMLSLAVESDPAQNAVVDYPAAQMALSAATAPTFAWHIGESAHLGSPSLREWKRAANSIFTARVAYAHGAPINGRGYFLVFSTPSNPELLRVFTTELTYTPDAAAWAKLVSAGAPITLTMTNAIFEDNRVAQDGGPYAGSAISFTITP